MADEIRQPGNVERVQPANPSRGAGQRKRRPLPPKPSPDGRQGPAPAPDDEPHRVDEYV